MSGASDMLFRIFGGKACKRDGTAGGACPRARQYHPKATGSEGHAAKFLLA